MNTRLLADLTYVFELFAFCVEFLHLSCKLSFGFGEFQFLRRDDLDDSIIDVQSTHPLTQALAGV